jgi:hypothetical protein
MNTRKLIAPALLASLGLATIVGSIAIAEPAKDAKPAAAAAAPAGQPEMKLPPGWTEADMQACMLAGMPGKQHEQLTKDVGTWQGKNTLWMVPGAEPVVTDSTSTVTAIMDGRYTKLEMAGEMPGMGPFSGMAITGFDNVLQKFVCSWIDSASTGIMQGTGELSPDGRTITWNFAYNCPITKKPAVLRQVDTRTGANTKTIEMFGNDPKSGKEFKMMSIALTKK